VKDTKQKRHWVLLFLVVKKETDHPFAQGDVAWAASPQGHLVWQKI